MRIPDKVIIGGMPFEVKRVIESNCGVEHEGRIDYRNQLITIIDAGNEYAKVTFLHECIHGMLESLGLYEENKKEALIDGLAHQLRQLLDDNPQLFEKTYEPAQAEDAPL